MGVTIKKTLSKILIVVSFLCVIFFIIVNADNWAYYMSWYSYPTGRSLRTRFGNYLRSTYGIERAVDIEWDIEKRTLKIIESGYNVKAFCIILFLLIITIIFDRRVYERVNKRLIVWSIVCIVIVFLITFVTSPDYANSIYE